MERPRAHPTIWISLALALFALALPAGAAAAERTVSVTGRATIEVPNDTASIGLGVSVPRPTKSTALRAASARLRKVIVAAQKIPGVGEGDVRTGSISVRRFERGEKVRYGASQGISVTLHEAARAGELIDAAIRAGASGIRGPTFYVGDRQASYDRALAAAFDVAKEKATVLAGRAGAKLGPAVTIVESGRPPAVPPPAAPATPPPPLPGTKAETVAPPPPTKPSTTTVSATVSAVFALE